MKISLKRTSACVVALGLALSFVMPVKAGIQEPMSFIGGSLVGAAAMIAYRLATESSEGFAKGVLAPIKKAAGYIKDNAFWVALATAGLAYSKTGRNLLGTVSGHVAGATVQGASSTYKGVNRWAHSPSVDNYQGINLRLTTTSFAGMATGAGFGNLIYDRLMK